jgi:hypothetical protein
MRSNAALRLVFSREERRFQRTKELNGPVPPDVWQGVVPVVYADRP